MTNEDPSLTPFATPDAPPAGAPPVEQRGPAAAVLGILLAMYSVLQIGFALVILVEGLVVDPEDVVFVAGFLLSGGCGLFAGWRLGDRRAAGWPLYVPIALHLLAAAAIVVREVRA